MQLWRISNYADLSGRGGELAEGRWHSRGSPILYCAESPAGALVEFLVHLPDDLFPSHFQLIALHVDGVVPETIKPDELPADWAGHMAVSRRLGDRWLAAASSLTLQVPSVLLPETFNMLINPRHPDAALLRIVKADKIPLDRRLARR